MSNGPFHGGEHSEIGTKPLGTICHRYSVYWSFGSAVGNERCFSWPIVSLLVHRVIGSLTCLKILSSNSSALRCHDILKDYAVKCTNQGISIQRLKPRDKTNAGSFCCCESTLETLMFSLCCRRFILQYTHAFTLKSDFNISINYSITIHIL